MIGKEGFMRQFLDRLWFGLLLAAVFTESGFAQKALTWQEVRDKFEASNPTLKAGQIGVDESCAQEITAYLRPNPTLNLIADQIDPFPGGPPHGPFAYLLAVGSGSYLLEHQHKRELGLESAQKATEMAVSAYATVISTAILLKPYKERYLRQATSVRDTIEFSYQHGAASLLDFLNAQADYRSVEVAYLSLIGSYLDAANQWNLAVGHEVIP
jgi:hypothetical protein